MPNIFLRKRKNNISNKYKISKKKKINDSGYIRHFPPANIEWSNSIYAYNKNYVKTLPTFEKIITKLIKSYFSLYHIKRKLKPNKRRLHVLLKRLSTNRMFVSKADIKHTNTKAIITVYIYNAERRYILNKLKKIDPMLTLSTKKQNKKIRLITLKTIKVINLTKKIIFKLKKTIKWGKDIYEYPLTQQYKKFLKKLLRKEKRNIFYKYLLWLNKSKFQDTYINPFNKLLRNFLNKNIEFNLVNLKYYYLNSSIFSQLIAIKLKRRSNRLLKVLKFFLRGVNLPDLDKLSERFAFLNKQERKSFFKRVKSLSIFNNEFLYKRSNDILAKKDLINQVLQEITLKKDKKDKENFIENTVLKTLKEKVVAGVRIEASGRLTRRLIAARSIHKVRYKGSLKNIDSSYKGLPSVMLRGHVKSNIQYTKITSKTRNGSFGLKGWLSTM